MSVEIKVPALGESVSEATIAKWCKKQGDLVKIDELLLELETEKVTLEVNAQAAGILGQVLKNEGETVSVGEIIGMITEGTVAQVQAPATNIAAAAKQVEPEHAESKKIDPATTMPPSVQKLVAENNLNPLNIQATGKDGRINKGDVLEHLSSNQVQITQAPLAQTSNTISQSKLDNEFQDKAAERTLVREHSFDPQNSLGSFSNGKLYKPVERIKMSRLRKTIAQRLKDSQNTAAILSTFNEIDMTNVIAMRAKYREEFEKKHGVKLGFMSFFVKAVIEALKEVPSVNAEIDGDDLVYKNYYDIGVAVGTEQGLVVPIVRAADKLSFSAIELEIGKLGKKAREGKLSMSDLSGGTFTISNGGVYGSLLSTPIINPPQAGILGLHKTMERVMVVDGKIEIRQMMYVALSYDHRIIDGKEAVTFLVKVKEAIENPTRLLLNI